jgi:hypothetical protein
MTKGRERFHGLKSIGEVIDSLATIRKPKLNVVE